MAENYELRRPAAYLPEQEFLKARMAQVEEGMGRIAARLGQPTPITSPLDVMDRARELVSDLSREVTVRPLDDAIVARLDWLDRAEGRLGSSSGEPDLALTRIPVDRVLLRELLAGWQARRN